MLEIFSYLLNVFSVCAFASLKWADIDKYHDKLDSLQERVKEIELDSKSYWLHNHNEETKRLSSQITTEIHHLIREAQSLSRRHTSFNYDHLQKHLLDFKKTITGGTFETATRLSDEQKVERIGESALHLCDHIDSFRVNRKLLSSLIFWKSV